VRPESSTILSTRLAQNNQLLNITWAIVYMLILNYLYIVNNCPPDSYYTNIVLDNLQHHFSD
jgi:hypothetical protein